MNPDRTEQVRRRRLRTAGFAAVAVAGHGVLAWWVGQAPPSVPTPSAPPILNLILAPPPVRIPPPEAEPPPQEREIEQTPGGGRPAAPSVVRPAVAPDIPAEVAAPPTPAPEQPLVIGMASDASETPDMGQGGEGTGTGTGHGDGAGSGAGPGGRPVFVRGPDLREIVAHYPPAARAARLDGQASVSCRVRLDQRLEDCRVLRETPAGHGFGAAAVAVAERAFRFRPRTVRGRPVADAEVVVGVPFGRGVPGG
ncbi:MAG TPA: TonB family protein [Brevundimonas sp.]|uniref:TonB family protein n=1 Tax=Brevundimonas sp. TaxID=1871086 RepID=UPI00261F7FD3|nr:TonB family protein [Brevundimonas sp.]HRO32727.1 TonB family protein [Brevundimonas sp.]